MTTRFRNLFLLAALSVLAARATAAEIYVGCEHFRWTETDTAGNRLLTENGPLYSIGTDATHALGKSAELDGRVEGFLGEVDYDGHTQDGSPLFTTTQYYGLAGDLDARLPFSIAENFRLSPLAGVGARGWLRQLDNSPRDSTGYDEAWLTTFLRTGLRAAYAPREDAEFFAEAALRLPVYNTVHYSFNFDGSSEDVAVEPGCELTFAAEAGAKFHGTRVSAFYEQLKFSRSNTATISGFDVSQPDSDGSIIGLRIGIDL